MRRLVYLASARDDFADIQEYITRRSGSLAIGQSFVDLLRGQCRKLASLSGTLGRPRTELRPDIRSFAFKGYVIFFRYEGATFEVVNVLEGHRDVITYFRDDPTHCRLVRPTLGRGSSGLRYAPSGPHLLLRLPRLRAAMKAGASCRFSRNSCQQSEATGNQSPL